MSLSTSRSRLLASAAAILVAAALALLPATAASAHDYLVSSDPKADSTVVSAPARVSLAFDDVVLDLDGKGAIVQVTDAAGSHFETGCATVSGRTVNTPVALGAAGAYTVTWRIVSADGHPVSASISFRYAPPAGAVAAKGTASSACGTDAAGSGVLVATSPAPSAGSPAAIDPVPVIATAGGIVLAAIVAVVAILLLSRRRKSE